MTALILLGLSTLAIITGVVLMVRKRSEINGFPWFWVFFGIMVMSWVVLVTMSVGMDMVSSGSQTYSTDSSSAHMDIFQIYNYVVTAALALAVVGVIGSVWAWKKRRY
ncbi:hypothetical protein HCH15_08495 [Corynebacterium testudinoris]|uniref:Uncharacterized protein n=1 Tax=Corynebacterium testudinoris TaxID=136857 RepID=A0A0G3HED7_9CORY|nr:hypothetical protein [Corynebacterium testudinoris]AKK09537.1 hypothetical protein CTEST_10585 [Corynebacterium testudinoris]MBX8996218.1 hypothetical protein [Corynebacterium testudinoris]